MFCKLKIAKMVLMGAALGILCIGLTFGLYLQISICRKLKQKLQDKESLEHIDVKVDELEVFFNVNLDMLCIADTNGYFRALNPQWEQTLGYKVSELIGKQFIELVHPDDVQSTINATKDLAESKAVLDFENRYQHKDGTYRWIEWRSYPVNNKIYAAARDITARKIAEKALQKSEARYRLLFENITTGFALHEIIYDDKGNPVDFRYLEANSKFKELWDAAEDMEGKTLKEVFPFAPNEWVQHVYQVVATKEPSYMVQFFPNKGKHVEILQFWTGKDQFAAIFNDITDRVNAETALRESESRLRSFINESSEGVVILNEQGFIEEWNTTATSITGIESAEVLNKYWADVACLLFPQQLLTDEVNENIEKTITRVLRTGELKFPSKNIYTILHTSGNIKYIEQSLFTIQTEKGYRLSIIFNDISKRKKTEEALAQEKTFTDALLAGIPGLVYMYNDESLLVRWNKQHETATGYTAEELSKMHLTDWYKDSESDLTAINEGMSKLYTEGFGTAEAYLQKKNGEKILYYFTAIAINIGDKRYFTGIGIDITERKKAELALQKNESLLKATMESMKDGILVVSRTNSITHTNKSFALLFDIPDDLLSALNDNHVLNHVKQQVVDEEMFLTRINEINQSQDASEDILNLKNGRILERYSYPLRDGTLFNGRVWVFRDITEKRTTEELIAHERNMLRALIDNITDLVYIKDTESRFVIANKTLTKIIGTSIEYMLGKTDLELFPDNMAREFYDDEQRLFATGEPILNKDEMALDPKGNTVLFQTNKVPLRDHLGNIIGLVGTGHIVTEQKKAELALKKSESVLKATMEGMEDGVLVVSSERIITHFNKRFGQIFHIPEEILETRNDELVLSYAKRELSNQDQFELGVNEIYKSTLSTQETLYFADGRVIETLSYPLGNDLLGRVWLFRDITERQKTEKLIAYERNMLRTLIDTIPDFVYVKDTECRNVITNKTASDLLGVPIEDMLGRRDMDIYPEDKAQEFYNDELNLIATGIPVINKEERIWDKSGNEVVLQTTKLPLRDNNGTVVGLVGTGHIITEQKKAENEIKKLNEELERKVEERTLKLQELNKELEAFAYSVSHDLRAPLRHIDGFVRLLYSNIKAPAESISSYYEKIVMASKRMSGMIDELLTFSRLGRKELNCAPVDLNLLVNEIIEQYKPDIIYRKINWQTKNLPMVSGDRNLLRIAFENLISNAIKYTSKKTEAFIEMGSNTESGSQVLIYVRDNGAGFDMAYSDKLFGVFQRLHSPEEYEGIGIGLANVKQIILKHKGTIYAEGKVNEGATFYITLPK